MRGKQNVLYKEQRVGVFVDVQNLYYSAKHLYKSKLDFKNILMKAVGNRMLIRAIAYVVKADKSSDSGGIIVPGSEKSFFDALKTIGFEVKAKDLQVYGGFKKGDWDVGIAVDAIEMGTRLDVVIIISGDGDYVPLVEHLKRAFGCKVEVAAFGRSTSTKLKEAVDDFFDLDIDHEKYLIRSRPRVKKEQNKDENNNERKIIEMDE
ncbi:NYN domain-containing protein [Candidatus Aenigmatarchaeota archaeon]